MRHLLPALAATTLLACAHPALPAHPSPALPEHIAAPAPESFFADPDRDRKLASAFPTVDALVDAAVREGFPGVALGIVIDGKLAHFKGAGVADLQRKTAPDADTVFRIGSISKSFTALAILALRDDGAITLDDPLTRAIPEAAGLVYPTSDAPPITLRQLLTHTSGLPRLGEFNYTRADREPSEDDVVRSLAGFALENTPGTRPVYSNLGFGLLGIVAGRSAGMPLRAFMAKRILAPLEMSSTSFDPATLPPGKLATGYQKTGTPPALTPASPWRLGASEGAGGIYSTVRDMARYVAFQLSAYPPRSGPDLGPVRRSSVRESHFNALRHAPMRVRMRDASEAGESRVVAHALAYGYGWLNDESCEFDARIWHNGSVDGFVSAVSFLPQTGVGVVALANLGGGDLTALTEKTLIALRATGGLSARTHRAVLPPALGPALGRLLAVYNTWDLPAYQAMLSPARSVIGPEEERAELAGYRALHGACTGFTATETPRPQAATVAMQCERGTFEMSVSVDAKGLILGFGGTSRDVPPPPSVARAAERLAGFIKSWDDALYAKVLGANLAKTRAERVAFFDALRAGHGACAPKGYVRTNDAQRFTLACERGGDLGLTVKLDAKDEDAVASFAVVPEGGGACPAR